jgi:hypothetical protein
MTEAEWLAYEDPAPMLNFLRDAQATKDLSIHFGSTGAGLELPQATISERKLRLFACGCCRRIWHLLKDERSRAAFDCAERFADGRATDDELGAAELVARAAYEDAFRVALDQMGGDTEEKVEAEVEAEEGAEVSGPSARDLARDACAPESAAVSVIAFRPTSAWGWTSPAWSVRYAVRDPDARQAEERNQAEILRCVTGNPFRPITPAPSWFTSTVRTLAEGIYADRAFDRLPILTDALQDAGCENPDVLDHCRAPGPHVRGCWVVDLLLGKG